ncbi:hypothetical protein Tco_1284799, partial [Tanacetum coccineum]
CANHRVLIEEDTMKVMTKLILKECMEKAQAESSLAKPNTDNDMIIELNEEFFMELQSNAYYGLFHEDVFPISLADYARQWWKDEGMEKSQLGKN